MPRVLNRLLPASRGLQQLLYPQVEFLGVLVGHGLENTFRSTGQRHVAGFTLTSQHARAGARCGVLPAPVDDLAISPAPCSKD